ncbi:MAG: protein BatD [Bacteroidales bacterium]|nr:protein BatD [Bacteroidales bacterium]
MRQIYIHILFLALLLTGVDQLSAQVTFKASAPATVVEGEQFRLSYLLNQEGKDIRLPEISDFNILFGPSISTSFSQRTVNGKTTSENSVTYTYILEAKKTGTFTIPAASIKVNGSNYESNSLQIKVLPPDETPPQEAAPGGQRNEERSAATGNATVSTEDAFIRAIVSKNAPYEQEGFTVTFRLYTTLNVVNFGKIQFPEFEGFMVEEINLPANQQLQMERYNGRNYYTADLRKTLLFPQRSGQISIPRGSLEMVFSVPSGRRVSTFFGTQEVMVDVKKNLVTNPLSINVKPLPANRPPSYANAVGLFNLKSGINATTVKANEAITITLEVSGTGNMKLIRNPEIEFPNNFETYDPTVTNSLNVTTNGLTGIRKIEYMAIPRYEGTYTIPAVEFTYFDPAKNSYETLTMAEQHLQIEKGEQGSGTTGTFVNRQDVKVEQDIRFLKIEEPSYLSATSFFVGSVSYWLWYLIPLLALILLFLINRKQARENANVALMRNRKANKMAIKRLKTANNYLKEEDKEHFYEEVLRAIWGYFSDKLSIPLARLSKNNIEAELSKKGVSESLANQFMEILDSCEFARYAPAESNAEMGQIYNDTMKAIEEMEGKLRKSGKVES